MPRGFDGVREASAQLSKRGTGGGPSSLWFRLRSGEETTVRFLEAGEDINWVMTHDVPVEGRAWGKAVPCLDQERDGTPCPGCERDLPRKFKGFINVLWVDAPVFKRDAEGKMVRDRLNDPVIIDNKPQVAIWSSGIRLFEDLAEIDANYKGLSSRRFKVKRKGEKLDTKYVINPEDIDAGQQPPTPEEQALIDQKYDLTPHVTPGTYDEFMSELNGGGGQSGGGGGFQQSQVPDNPFMKRR